MLSRSPFVVAVVLGFGCGGSQATGPASRTGSPEATTASVAAPAAFSDVAAKLGLVFEMPAGFTEVAVHENVDVSYNHALVSADRRIEMRFALRPYATDMPEPLRTREFSRTFFSTAIMNLTHGGQTGESTSPDPLHHEEFNADEARMVVVRFHESNHRPEHFGNGYELCAAIFLHRDGFGDAYTFVLFKDRAALEGMDEDKMHSLRFASRPAPSSP
jgi:hypothetical protein